MKISLVSWRLTLTFAMFVFVFTPVVQSSTDDDTELQFYWMPAAGNVQYYNVYLFVYDNPDAPGPVSEDDYVLVDTTFKKLGSSAPTQTQFYALIDTIVPVTIEDGKGYQLKVAAVDTNGIVGPRSEVSEIVWCKLAGPSNHPPVADDGSVNINEDTSVDITLTGSDPDDDTLTYIVVINPANGSLNGEASNLTYMPNAGFNGSDSFTFKVSDGVTDSNLATVSITVNPVVEITAMIRVDILDNYYNEATRQSFVTSAWTNIGSERLSRPLRMVFEYIKPSSVSIANADGITSDGKPYHDYSDLVGDGLLEPGETSETKLIILNGPSGVLDHENFTFDLGFRACVEHAASTSSLVTNYIADSPDDIPNTLFSSYRELAADWNLISLPLQSSESHPGAVLSSIDGKFSSVWARNPFTGWSIYTPGVPSNLQSMEPGVGYWIKMNESANLIFEGTDPEQTYVFLKGGEWNLVGYGCRELRNVEECMRQVADDINSVWEYNSETGWSIYIPGGASNLQIMKPGYGYWIKANENCIWDVNAIGPLSNVCLTAN